jgi:Arm DNA-binding domain
MARTIGRLKALAVERIKQPGMYADSGGLWLQVTSPAAKSWVFRYAVNGRERYAGLGSAFTISLQRAREDARRFRELLHDGVDPIEHRKAERQQKKLEAAKTMTFDQCAAAYIESHEAGWRNAKHAAQWRSTLKQFVSPVFGELPVQAIDTALVMKVLEPIWRPRPRRPAAFAGASRAFWVGQRCASFAAAITLHAGAATSGNCFQRAPGCARKSTLPRYPTPKSTHW